MKSISPQLMVYGTNGYSAQLIIDDLIRRGIKPILAGRNKFAIKQLAEKYDCDYKVFDIEDDEKVVAALEGVHTVLNCAGPFRYTAKDLIDACISSKTNYLDITGEIPVLHLAFMQNEAAKKSGIVILPGVGFDIIPTDCLAKRLSELMPDATHLKLGFLNKRGKISRGTLLTTLESLGGAGRIRRNGVLLESEIGEFTIKVNTKNFLFRGISIPWGDVYTSFYSTGIPNVEVYFGLPSLLVQFRSLLKFVLRIFRITAVKNFASNYIKKNLPDRQKWNAIQPALMCGDGLKMQKVR